MIVFDLKCAANAHVFEAWFGSSTDYADQKARGLLTCPICGDADVDKALMAPAVAAKGNRSIMPRPSSAPAPASTEAPVMTGEDAGKLRGMMEALASAQKKALEGSTWVGRGFAEQARAMHYGEQAHSSIHGEVAPAEAKALMQEGVPVAPLPFPVVPPEAKN